MSRLGVITINGVGYDLDDLTLDEMEEIENIVGAAFSEVNYGSSKGLKAFTYVLLRRTNPEITMAEVGKIKVAEFIEPDEVMPELPPDGPGDQGTQSPGQPPPDDSGPQPSVESTDG